MNTAPTQLKAEKDDATSHLSGSDKLSEWNDPRQWWRTLNPPLINRRKYQKRIDEITGLTVRRQSKILLRWAWESNYQMFGRTRMRYNFITLLVNGVDTDFSVPRWVMEERIEPEQIRESWDSNRYVLEPGSVVNDVDPLTGKVRKVIHAGDKLDKGECPREWFRNLWVIADHDSLCCKKAKKMNRVCWGYYRHPDSRDVRRVEKIHWMKVRDETFNQSPFEVLSPETLEASQKSAFEETEYHRLVQSREFDARFEDVFRTHEYSLAFDSPRYLFSKGLQVTPHKKTEGGILLP